MKRNKVNPIINMINTDISSSTGSSFCPLLEYLPLIYPSFFLRSLALIAHTITGV